MRIGKFEISWSDIGKIIAGIVTIFVSFYIFYHVNSMWRIIFLALLVVIFFSYRKILARKIMSPNLQKKLESDHGHKKYGS